MGILSAMVMRGLVALGFRFDPHAPLWGFKTSGGWKHVFVVRIMQHKPEGSVGIRCYAFWDNGDSDDWGETPFLFDAQTLISYALGFFREFHAWTE